MKTRKILSLILTVAMLVSFLAFPVSAAETDENESLVLTDVDSSTDVGKAVNRLVSRGIINGYNDGTYRPGNAITRAEFCVVMVKFQDQQDYIDADSMTGFEDLDLDANYAWARPYVAKAVELGIINGFEDKTFRAADPVTYEQAVKMIVCALGYESEGQKPTIVGDWSSGYIAKAMTLRVTSGTSIANKSNPTTRGVVAMLVANALDAERNTNKTPNIDMPSNPDAQLGYKEVKGVVTGTYLTEIDDANSTVPKNCVQIDDEVYEIGFSRDPNEFLGCEVEAIIRKAKGSEDYDVVTSIEVTSRCKVLEIEAGLVGEYEDGVLEYQVKRNGNSKNAKIDEDYVTIFNNKYYEYDIADLKDELTDGSVVLVDSNGDGRYDVVRINSYEVFVVYSKNTSGQKITLMYDAEYEGENTIVFPEESTSTIFSLTRNGKEISFSDIAKWDVLNIKASPADAEGKAYYEVVVTRESYSGMITERDSDDENSIVMNDKEYIISDSLMEYIEKGGDSVPKIEVGEYTQIYLDAAKKVVAAAEATTKNSAEKYAYLVALRQDSDKTEYDLQFKFYTTDGKFLEIGSAAKISIDGKKYKALDDDILDVLEASAEAANGSYPDADNYTYHQPIIYQTNSEGLVSVIHTVNSDENTGISMSMKNDDDELYYSEYEQRQYKSSSKSFTDFKVSSSTKIMYIPDNRNNTDDYLTFSSYSKAFSNGRTYNVEAFGLSSSGTASIVFIYKENDSRIYTSSSPWMIVASKKNTASGTVIKGYTGTSYSLKSVTVSEEDGPSTSDIGKGDIIRYILDGNNELVDYQIWFDASDPTQLQPVSTNNDLYVESEKNSDGANRIIEIHSTSTEPRKNYPSATFRLQFGTVTQLVLADDDANIDDDMISISSVLVEDNLAMDYFDKESTSNNSSITKEIGSSVKVFSYDRSGKNNDVVTEADITEILDYDNYGEDATRVIAYTASGTLRMIYIIFE